MGRRRHFSSVTTVRGVSRLSSTYAGWGWGSIHEDIPVTIFVRPNREGGAGREDVLPPDPEEGLPEKETPPEGPRLTPDLPPPGNLGPEG